MFVLSPDSLQNIDGARDLKTSSGVVAARIRALQSAQSYSFSPQLDSPKRPFASSPSVESRAHIDRGHRYDASLASPANTDLEDSMEKVRKDAQLPADVQPQTSGSACEGAHKCSRPFSRVLNHTCNSRDLEQIDGTIELRTAKSRLRPITERKETQPGKKSERDLTMDDLGSMLEDAIVQTAESPASSVAHAVPQDELTEPSASAVQSKSRSRSRSPTHHELHHDSAQASAIAAVQSSPLEVDELPQVKSTIPQNSTGNSVERNEHDVVPVRIGTATLPTSDRLIQNSNVFPRYNSQSRHKQFDLRNRGSSVVRAEPSFGTLGPGLSPVKQRTALWETLTDTSSLVDGLRPGSPTHDGQRKGEWSYYQRSNERRLSRLGRGLPSHRRVLSNPHPGSDLIPLTLPRLVKRATSQHRPVSTLVMQHTSRDKESIQHINEDSVTALEAISDGDISPKSRGGSIGRDMASQSSLSHSVHTSQAAVDKSTPELRPRRSNSRRPSKWDLLRRPSVVSRASREAPIEKDPECPDQIRPSRPSVVESKIHELMAASKQSEDAVQPVPRKTRDTGQVKLSSIVENVPDAASMSTRLLPALQPSIAEQAQALRRDSATSLQSPMILTPKDDPFFPKEYREPISSPVKVDQSTPTTPVRGRPKTVKQAFSQRGTPYAFEQRFSLSPSRSRSRCGTSGVRVSVEVRNSPERSRDGFDEHEVIVRASVEPDEFLEDLEE